MECTCVLLGPNWEKVRERTNGKRLKVTSISLFNCPWFSTFATPDETDTLAKVNLLYLTLSGALDDNFGPWRSCLNFNLPPFTFIHFVREVKEGQTSPVNWTVTCQSVSLKVTHTYIDTLRGRERESEYLKWFNLIVWIYFVSSAI